MSTETLVTTRRMDEAESGAAVRLHPVVGRASSNRKPHNGDAGYIAEKIFRPSGSHIVIYKAAEQGIDAGGDKYAVVCSKHASIVSDTNLPGARVSMKYPAFCEDCMAEERSTPNAEVSDPGGPARPNSRQT
jgi:hypothetical protein